MKTIKYFLTSVFTILLAIASIIYGVSLITTSTTLYTKLGDTTPITFTATFVFTGIILVAIGFLLITVSYTSFSISRKYYLNYLTNKRDRDIRSNLENEKYMQFYKDLQDSPTLELKEIVYKNFYYADREQSNNACNRTTEENFKKFKDMLDS